MDFVALSTVPSSQILKFVHHVIDNMCGGMLVSQSEYIQCPLEKFWLAQQNVKDLCKGIILDNISKEDTVSSLHSLPKETAEEVHDAILARKAEIRESFVGDSIRDTLHLRDFDWNVRLAIASDKVLDLNEGLVTLHLHTSSTRLDKDVQDISVEMSTSQVDKLLEKLKEAQQKLSLMKSK